MPIPNAIHWTTLRGPDPRNPPNLVVNYDQVAEYKERLDGRVVESVRFLQIAWPQRFNLIKALLGTAYQKATDSSIENITLTPYGLPAFRTLWQQTHGVNLAYMQDVTATHMPVYRLLPEPHPEIPNLVAVAAEVLEGKGYPVLDSNISARALQFYQNSPAADVQYLGQGVARIAVTYRTLPYNTQVQDSAVNIAGGSELSRYVWREPFPSAQNLPIQGTFFRELNLDVNPIALAPTAITEPGIKTYPFIRFTYHWFMVPAIPPALFYMMNGLNSTIFDSPNIPIAQFAPIGNMQYLSPKISEVYYTFHGDAVYDVKLNFVLRQPGPNWRFRPALNYFRLGIASWPGIAALTVINNPPEPLIAGLGLFNYYELSNLFKLGSINGQRVPLAIA